MINEIWKDIKGFEGRYLVSSQGRVKSLARVKIRRKMGATNIPERILTCHADKIGYPRLVLFGDDFQRREFVHRLVAEAFISRVKGCNTINHKNGVKKDNRVENLEWCTQSQNSQHAYDTGLAVAVKGEFLPQSKLSIADVKKIKTILLVGNVFIKDIAKMFGVSESCISLIKRGENWKHVNID